MPDPHVSEIWRNWALIVGGAAGLVLAVWRGLAVDRQSKASRSQAETARRTHRTEVFKDATGQLSHDRLEIRLGAIYTLGRIGKDFPEFEHYVFQVLTAFVRERSGSADPDSDPEMDIVEALDLILALVRKIGTKTATDKIQAHVDLSGAVIPRTSLSGANLAFAKLEKTILSGADLSKVILIGAQLTGSILKGVNLAHADLSSADLSKVDLSDADLSGSLLVGAKLGSAKLGKANLRGADLSGAHDVFWSDILSAHVDDITVFPETLDESYFFEYITMKTSHLKTDWHSMRSNGVSAVMVIRELNGQIVHAGLDKTIDEYLHDADFYQFMAQREEEIGQKHDE